MCFVFLVHSLFLLACFFLERRGFPTEVPLPFFLCPCVCVCVCVRAVFFFSFFQRSSCVVAFSMYLPYKEGVLYFSSLRYY